MLIPSAGAWSPCTAGVAIDGKAPSSSDGPGVAPPDTSQAPTTPDVVVTLGQGTPPGASTYDASGRMSGSVALDGSAASAADPVSAAVESGGDPGATPATPTGSGDPAGNATGQDAATAA